MKIMKNMLSQLLYTLGYKMYGSPWLLGSSWCAWWTVYYVLKIYVYAQKGTTDGFPVLYQIIFDSIL